MVDLEINIERFLLVFVHGFLLRDFIGLFFVSEPKICNTIISKEMTGSE